MGVNSQNATIKKGSFTTEGYQGWEDWWNTRALWVWECYTGIEYTNGSRTDETRWIRWRCGRERMLNTKNAFHAQVVSAKGGWCVSWGVCPVGVSRACLPKGRGVHPTGPRGRHPQANTSIPLHAGIHPLPSACWDTYPLAHCMLGYTPPVNRMTHRCKNLTFPQTLFADSNKRPTEKVH